jgi:hypothetical protein
MVLHQAAKHAALVDRHDELAARVHTAAGESTDAAAVEQVAILREELAAAASRDSAAAEAELLGQVGRLRRSDVEQSDGENRAMVVLRRRPRDALNPPWRMPGPQLRAMGVRFLRCD